MWIKRRYYQYKLITHGETLTDKIKLLILALFFTLPNKITNMNAQTPKPLIWLTQGLTVHNQGYKWRLTHPRQIFMISKGYEANIAHYFNIHGDTFLDIGANIGKYTLQQSQNFREIHSFEPIPETYEALEYNVKENKLKNVKLHQVAAWNKEEPLTFYIKNNPGGNSAEMQEIYHKIIKVKATRIDRLLAGITCVDLVKIDVEGAEPQALEGMKHLIDENRPIMIIEILEENEEKVYNFMAHMQYHLVQKQNRNHLWYPLEIVPRLSP